MSMYNVGKPIVVPTHPRTVGLPNLPETAVDYPSTGSADQEQQVVLAREEGYARQVMTRLTLHLPAASGLVDQGDLLALRGWYLGQWCWEDFEETPLPEPMKRALALGGFVWVPFTGRASVFADYQDRDRVRYIRLLDLAVRYWLQVDEEADVMTALARLLGLEGKVRAWWFGELDVTAPDFA